MLSSRVSSARIGSRTAARPTVVVRSLGYGTTGAFPDGSKVKVNAPLIVWHVPKHPEGLQLEGLVGEVEKDASQYKGKVLSPLHPIVVKYVKNFDGKDVKFKVHLGEDEMEMA
eukprot:gene9792-7681_t